MPENYSLERSMAPVMDYEEEEKAIAPELDEDTLDEDDERYSSRGSMVSDDDKKFRTRNEGDYMDDEDIIQSKKKQEVYEELEKTKEYAEMQYYNIKHPDEEKNLVQLNQFWLAFMDHLISENPTPYLTNLFKYATNSYTELIFVLAVLDLPFIQGNHRYEASDNQEGIEVTVDSNVILFYKEILEAE
eukprot:CAMPEP_0114582150 /NCGR_PEP_ID=MMETSP0125-20121206/6177_1 /TAXON_ID=485358 ORGANISM="Aristerostoma sp., Strain ATCC 50986" /NCGR_SAMPLE_ID=MMETSP0125 /ASSEMBLY_ACC=CAM_ASM_000245 /LENGTH=187 /DNA_ID=CAMNT_0001774907 /DNA_START=4584 /DNA_END=5147 /DNA_ORIENTATION=-